MLTGSLAIRLRWSLVEPLIGLSARWFWLFLGREEGFLARGAGLLFLGVTAGFFSLIIFTVDWGDAAVVSDFLAVVEGARVVRETVFDVTERPFDMGVVRGTLCVLWLYGLIRGVVCVSEKR